MPNTRNDRNLAALIAGFVLVAAAVLMAFLAADRQRAAVGRVSHTIEVQKSLQTVLSLLQEAETGQRGYLLTGEADFLEPYERATARLDGSLIELERMVADNPQQRQRVARLRQAAERRLARLASGITLLQQGNRSRASDPARLREGKAMMDEVRGIVASLDTAERRLLTVRDADVEQSTRRLTAGYLVTGLALLTLASYAVINARRRALAAQAQSAELEASNVQLREEAESRQRAEAQVRQMQKTEAISQLTGGIAHDFNNMLTIITGSLDLADRRMERDPPRARQLIGNAREAADRAGQLTARLLAFSRQQPLAPGIIDLNKLVSGMSELLARTLGDDIRLETVLAAGLWRSFADASQLESAVLNLCVNARDAMPEGGRLTLETANCHLDDAYAAAHAEVSAGQYVMVSVTDTGTGMPADVIERAFDPFYTTKPPGKGTGLGLSQVEGFVRQSGGHIKIYSEAGAGTAVKIYLPRHTGPGTAAVARDPAAAGLPLGQGELVLVVDDDDRVRQTSAGALAELGYQVLEAAGGAAALALLAEHPGVALLFTDVMMPDMNGRQLAEAATARHPGLKVLYTTGYTRNAIVHNGMLDGGVNFLAKPFTLAQLAVKLREVLDV
jgi:signal transduction histidine kinase